MTDQTDTLSRSSTLPERAGWGNVAKKEREKG